MTTAPTILVAPGTARAGEEFFDYSVNLSDAYTSALVQAGGVPFIAPCAPAQKLVAELVDRVDGVLLTGGDDIQTSLYLNRVPEAQQKTCSEPDATRDLFETLIINEVFRQRKPLLAICRGHQMMNVALGGKLIVDLPTLHPGPIKHSRMDLKDKVVHPINISEDSMLRKILGVSRIGVNSTHHQAIDELAIASPLKSVALADDGVIEAIELWEPILPYFLGVQFHPERLIWRHPEFLELFRSFTAACAVNRKRHL